MSNSIDGLIIADATQADVSAVCDLLALLKVERPMVTDRERQAWAVRRILSTPERARLLVARDAAGTVVGMCQLVFFVSVIDCALAAWVESIVVRTEMRGSGVGRALLEAAEAFCRAHGIVRMSSHLSEDNRSMKAILTVSGFEPTGRVVTGKRVSPLPKRLG